MVYVDVDLMPRHGIWNPAQAVNYARGQVTHPQRNWRGQCDSFAGGWSWGFGGSGWTSAQAHYNGTKNSLKHHLDVHHAPLAAIVFWEAGKNGHAALVVGENGMVASTDILRPGRVDIVPFEMIHAKWNLKLLGWAIPDLRPAWGRNPIQPVPSKVHLPGQ